MPNPLSTPVSFMCGLRLLSSRKLTQPIVRTIPQAQVSGLPLAGERPGELAAHHLVLPVQVLPAEGVGQRYDHVMDRPGRRRHRGFATATLLRPGHSVSPYTKSYCSFYVGDNTAG